MNLFLKIMIIVGFGILITESNGAEVASDNVLRLRMRDGSGGSILFGITVNKQKLAFHVADQLDDVLRVYNVSSPGPVNHQLFFTIETKEGFVFSNIRCNLSLRRDISSIFLNNCESNEVRLSNKRIHLHFSWIENRGRKIEVN